MTVAVHQIYKLLKQRSTLLSRTSYHATMLLFATSRVLWELIRAVRLLNRKVRVLLLDHESPDRDLVDSGQIALQQ